MIAPTPVIFIHGFIGTFDVRGWNGPHRCPDLLGYGAHPMQTVRLTTRRVRRNMVERRDC